jgi:hypothetical protein
MGRSVFIAALAGLLFFQSAGAEEKAAVKCAFTYGPHGPPRTGKFLLFEPVFVQQTVSGLAHDDANKIDISVSLELLDKSGKVIFSLPWDRHNREYPSSIFFFSYTFGFGTDVEKDKAGTYTGRLHLHDHIADVRTHCDATFELIPADGLAVYGLRCGQDPTGKSFAGVSFALGESIYVHGLLANVAVENHRAKCRASLRVLDASGKPSGTMHLTIPLEHAPSRYEEVVLKGFSLSIPAIEAGQFIAEVRVEDLISGQETTEYIPFLVSDPSSLTVPDSLRTASKPRDDGAKKR